MRKGEVSLDDISEILFQSRYSRLDSRDTISSLKTGIYCKVEGCRAIVLDLHSHLTRVHCLATSDSTYIKCFTDTESVQRQVFFKNPGRKFNPMADLNQNVRLTTNLVNLISKSSRTILHSDIVPSDIDVINSDVDSPYFDFAPSVVDEVSQDASVSNFFIPKNINKTISQKFLDVITTYRQYSSSISGGSRSDKFARMDMTNLIHILNSVGEENFFQISKLNEHFTLELKSKRSPSTLSSRLLSLSRFIEYLNIHASPLLPIGKDFDKLVSSIKGIILSLNKLKKRQQQSIMTQSRKNYTNTVKVLKEWRKLREKHKFDHIFRKYENSTPKLLRQEYLKMRDFLITELTIPNGIRPGVISGLIIEEINTAETNITREGYHRVMVSTHKTGYIHAATLFIYPVIFTALKTFVNKVLKLLPHYIRTPQELSYQSNVFQTYTGVTIPSSRVTPILRDHLSLMGISFSGTITDLRKAAATLTAKYDPKLQDIMSLFLGHSRKAHDRYYKMNIGHDGLTDAFNNLETFQTSPDAEPSHYVTSKYLTSNISPTNVYSSDICEDTPSLNQTIFCESRQESFSLQSQSPNNSFQILTDSLTSNCRNPNTFQGRLQLERSAENSQTGEYDQSVISLPGTPTHSTQDLSNPLVSNLNLSTFQDNSSRIQSVYTIQNLVFHCLKLQRAQYYCRILL